MAFLGWFGHYLLIFVVMVAVAALGFFVGKKLGNKKAAQKEAEAAQAGNEE